MLVDAKNISFHQYLRLCLERDTIVFGTVLSYEHNFSSPARASTLAHLDMPFILALILQTSARINNKHKVANFSRNHDNNVKLGAYNGAWYTERNGISLMALSQMLMT